MRYLVFAGECYYAHGGFNDLADAFNEEADALRYANHVVENFFECEWSHVMDTDTMEVIGEFGDKPYGSRHD